MKPLSRGEQLGLGAIGLELVLGSFVLRELVRRPEYLDAHRSEIHGAVTRTLSGAAPHPATEQHAEDELSDGGVVEKDETESDAGVISPVSTEIPQLTLTSLLPTIPVEHIASEWERFADACRTGRIQCSALRPGGWGLPMAIPMAANEETKKQPIVTPASSAHQTTAPQLKKVFPHSGYGPRHGSLTVIPPILKIKDPKLVTDSIRVKIRQFQLDEMTSVFQGMTRDQIAFNKHNAGLLLMLLSDMTRDPIYASDMIRNLNTDCAVFIEDVTLLVNQYAIENDESMQAPDAGIQDAGAPTQNNAEYLSWLTGIENLGFVRNQYGALEWQNIPATLQECP